MFLNREMLRKYKKTSLFLMLMPIIFFAREPITELLKALSGDNISGKYIYAPAGDVVYSVEETGTVLYPSGKKLQFSNNYKSYQQYVSELGRVTITGKNLGNIDEKLDVLIRNEGFEFSFGNSQSGDFCTKHFSDLYPVALKKFFYFMPNSYLFKGKTWKGYFCDGRIECRYEIRSMDESSSHIELNCTGVFDKKNLNVNADMLLLKDNHLFKNVEARISIESDYIKSEWEIKEQKEEL